MRVLLLASLLLNVSCSSVSYNMTRAVIDSAIGPKESKTVVENRTVYETKEVKTVTINVSEKEDLKHSEDVKLGQKRVFFYPNP